MKSKGHVPERIYPQLQHIEIWAKIDQYLQSWNQICINFMTSFSKKQNFEFRRHFDDVIMFIMGKQPMKSYLQLILNMFIKKKLGVRGLFFEL